MSASVQRISVFLVGQNRLLRESLTRILDKKDDIAVVGACAFSPLVLDEITATVPDVLLMDSFTIVVPHLKFIREVQRRVPGIKVVMIGMDGEEQSFLQAVREGAVGYVLEDAPSLELIGAVRAVVKGQAICPLELCGCLFHQVAMRWNQTPNFKVKCNLGLTNREQQLVFLLGRGLSNKEIADQLQLAEQTVRNHVHHMLRKLRASDRLAVVEMCRMEGLPV
jgi:two-component system, NarL family, response regulator DevR